MFRKFSIAALAVCFVVSLGYAQERKAAAAPKLKVGDEAPKFTDLPGTDDKKHSFDDWKDKDVLVIAFTCNHCPVAVGYEDRIIEFTKKHAGKDAKVAVVAISVSTMDADKLPKMIERSKEKGFNFTYLYDESQQVGRDYGARVTPEFFVLNKDRKVVYHGAMDESNDASEAKTNYLEAAVSATLKGEQPVTTETKARGCGMRYNKKSA